MNGSKHSTRRVDISKRSLVRSLRRPLLASGFVLLVGAIPATMLAFESPTSQNLSSTERYRGLIVQGIELQMESESGSVPEAAFGLVELKQGAPYTPDDVRRSIKQLFALRSLSDIKVEARREGDGVFVTFKLFPVPTVTGVRIQGLDDAPPTLRGLRDDLVEAAGLSAGEPLEVETLVPASDEIRKILTREGFLWASVEPEANFSSPAAEVVFHVDPGPPALLDASTQIVGAAPHVRAHLQKVLSLEPGQPYSRRRLDAKLDKVLEGWRSRGFYGARVDIRERVQPPSQVGLDLEVEIGPKVLIGVESTDLSDRRLKDLVPIYEEKNVTQDLIEESRANILDDFRERGFLEADVQVKDEMLVDGNYRSLIFQIESGPRFEVEEIRIAGVSQEFASEIHSNLVTVPRRRFRAAPFRQSVWNEDLLQVERLLDGRGFHRARVDSFRAPAKEDPERLVLTLEVDQGPQALVESLQVDGSRSLSPLDILQASQMDVGQPFNPSEVVESRERILKLYRDQGFRQITVAATTLMNESQTGASVSFQIDEGERTRVDQVIVSGLEVTRESSVRRLIPLEPGEPLSSSAVLDTRQRLLGTGLFSDVGVDVLPPDPETGESDVLVSVKEGPRTSFGYGFGYAERELARAEVEVTRRNLLGLNRTVSWFTRGSLRGSRFITTYRQPDTFGYNMPLLLSGFREEEDRTSFEFIRLGLGLQISKKVSADQTVFFRYNFSRTRVFELQVGVDQLDRQFRNLLLSTVSVSSLKDTRDDPINPSRGQFRILDLEYSSKFLGSRSPYLRGLAQQFYYFPLPKGMVAALGMRLGIAQTFREDRDALIPITERFFAGGANTLRGFGLDEASPVDVNGNEIGGNVLSVLNMELRVPILRNLGAVVFSDNGTVYRRLEVIELLRWRYNMGFGLRFQTPLGPIRVDYGFKLDRREGESRGRWHVSLGHAF